MKKLSLVNGVLRAIAHAGTVVVSTTYYMPHHGRGGNLGGGESFSQVYPLVTVNILSTYTAHVITLSYRCWRYAVDLQFQLCTRIGKTGSSVSGKTCATYQFSQFSIVNHDRPPVILVLLEFLARETRQTKTHTVAQTYTGTAGTKYIRDGRPASKRQRPE